MTIFKINVKKMKKEKIHYIPTKLKEQKMQQNALFLH
jgi:hypothetical protein